MLIIKNALQMKKYTNDFLSGYVFYRNISKSKARTFYSLKAMPSFHFKKICRHVPKGGQGGTCFPDFGRLEGAAGSSGAPPYFMPSQILRLWHMPDMYLRFL